LIMPARRKNKVPELASDDEAEDTKMNDSDGEEEEEESKLLETLDLLFSTRDLYEVLGVEKTANESQVRKGYHKKSLAYHPDRVQDENKRSQATQKFQALGAVYSIISDEKKRKLYDETGIVDEADRCIDKNRDWDEYWRLLFKKITINDIKNFEKEYQGSEEELKDLETAYCDGEGSMQYILDNVLCCNQEKDEERFSEILKVWIKQGRVPEFKAFTKESKKSKKQRKKGAESEAAEAKEHARELGLNGSDEDSLSKMIMQRQANRAAEADSFFDHLAQKYGGSSKPKKSKKK